MMKQILLAFSIPFATFAYGQPNLLVSELHTVAGDETVASLVGSAEGKAFLHSIESNNQWMHELLDSGPVERGEIVIPFLYSLWKEAPTLMESDAHRSMATACALAMGMRDLDAEWMTDRYLWYRDSWDEGILNIGYGDLNTYERRFIARGLQRPSWTTANALAHLNERVCIPRSQYAKAAWRSPYRGYNAFGDTVQGPMYYMPFKELWGSDAEMAIEVGGVCGSLSHVGAAAAIAAGIPALTMGEPGHCAYAVQTKPHVWQPAYSLSWKRSLHTTMTRPTWPSLELSQIAHLDEATSFEAGDYRREAEWYESQGEIQQANSAWQHAYRVNPYDEALFKGYAQFGKRHEMPRSWWESLSSDIQRSLLPEHPEPAWHLLQTDVFPSLLKNTNVKKRLRVFQTYLSNLDGWGPVRWNIEGAFDWAWKGKKGEVARKALLDMLLTSLVDDPKLGPAMVVWAMEKVKDDEALAVAFESSLLEQVGGEGEGRAAILSQLARNMLPAAAEEHDLETFQRIGKKASTLYAPRDVAVDPFAGELLSSGGALRIFNPGNRWDSPDKHWGVLEEHGGWFHTDNGDLPWFEVELPKFGNLTGVVLDSRSGQPGRAKGVRVLVSEDGQEWKQVGETKTGKTMQRIDLSATSPRARFVRFERDGSCMHYHRILIYGEPAS